MWCALLYCSRVSLTPASHSFHLVILLHRLLNPSQNLPKIVPCICRRPGQCGWRRPSCGRWRRARRRGRIRCAGPVASVWTAWEGRHRRRQGASQAWPAAGRVATTTATGDDDDVTAFDEFQDSGVSLRRTAGCWVGLGDLATSVSPARASELERRERAQESGVSVGGWHARVGDGVRTERRGGGGLLMMRH